MLDFTRREFVLSASAAGAAFGLPGPLTIASSAVAQTAGSLNPGNAKFHRFKVGDIEVTTVFDGAVTRDHDPGFVKNASLDEVKAALRKAGLADDRMPNVYTVTVVKLGGRLVMFDAGNGPGGAPASGMLADNMKAAGIDPATLSAIVVTHFHPDHIFGLMTKDNEQLFPRTEIIVPEAEYKFWTDAAVIEKLPEARRGLARRIQATLPGWKNLRQASAGADVLPGIRPLVTHGHSPGHTSYHVSAGAGQLMVLGDITNVPPINMANPGWHIAFDQDAAMAEAVRRKTFEQAIADKMVCTGYHWGMPGAGTIAKDGGGYVLVPVG